MESLLINLSDAHRILAYAVIFIGMFFEGEIILVLAGILIKNGSLDFLDTFVIAFVAAVFHDIGWWFLGKTIYAMGKKKILFINLEKTSNLLQGRNKRNGIYIFASKFAWALNRLVLMSSGYLKMPLKTLISYSVPAIAVWVIVFVSIGYFFANQTSILKKDVKTALVFISILFLVIILFENIFRKILRRNNKESDNF